MDDTITIPPSVRDGLLRYIEARIPTGGFLHAVLTNDLREAAVRADLSNRAALGDIALWLYHNAPRECWGDAQRVRDWLGETPTCPHGVFRHTTCYQCDPTAAILPRRTTQEGR